MCHASSDGVSCLSTFQLHSIPDEQQGVEIDAKMENLKILTDQLRKSLPSVAESTQNKEGWQRVSLIVDPGACDIVVDPRSFPSCPLRGNEASKVGEAFLTGAGDPVPRFGEKEVVVCIDSGGVRAIKTQCSTVAKPLLSGKRVIEAGHLVGSAGLGASSLTLTLARLIGLEREMVIAC